MKTYHMVTVLQLSGTSLDGGNSSNHKGRDHGLVVHCQKVHAPQRGLPTIALTSAE